jgi:hypothetical protein
MHMTPMQRPRAPNGYAIWLRLFECFVDPRLPPGIERLFGFRKQRGERVLDSARLFWLELEVHD